MAAMKASRKRRRWIRYAEPCAASSLYILATLLQVPDVLMVAYESQSEEEEMDETLRRFAVCIYWRHCCRCLTA
jgi:hypothetical protein